MTELMPYAAAIESIDLAREADFDLGSLHVRPPTCQVEWNGGSETLQRRVMQVLVALAQARGSVVSQEELISRCWRGLTVTDDAIVRCIGKLRKLAASYPDAPYVIETIPGVGYRLTSSGEIADDVADREPVQRRRSRIRIFGIAAAIVIVLVGIAIWVMRGAPDGESRPVRISVQPFDAVSDSADARSLARRIPNEIVNQLGDSQVEAFLAGGQADQQDASKQASGLIVTGILHQDNRNTNVDVRIEDAQSHEALWAMPFRRDSTKASDLPLEIAARVTDEANIIAFARAAKPPLTDSSALSALLQVADMIRDPPEGAWAQMIDRAQGLVARHPNFAFGHDVLAVAYAEAAQGIDVPDRAQAMRDAATQEANLTLKLDPEDAGPYVVLSDLQPDYDYRAREAILLRGLRLARHPKEPLGGLYSSEGRLLDIVGRLRESLSLKLVAHATDEWGAPKTAQLARAYANMGNLPAARRWLEKGVQLWPNHSGVRRVRQYVAGFYEKPSDALPIFNDLDEQAGSDEANVIWRTYVNAKAANSRQEADFAIRAIHEAAQGGKLPPEIAIMMTAGLGETQQAIEDANSALDHKQVLQAWFLFTPVTRALRADPGFVPLATRLGLIKYWRETGKLPDFCTDPQRRMECSPKLRAALKR